MAKVGKNSQKGGAKPGERRGGRKKGTPNKTTRTLKDAAMGALNAGNGAEAFFTNLKDNNPAAFAQFLKALLPTEIKMQAQVAVDLVDRIKRGHERVISNGN
jgi:hypothetical protein